MNLELNGSVAVIVGGANGIGRAIAHGFAQEGANVAIVDRSPQGQDITDDLGREFGIGGLGVVADVREYGEVKAAAVRIRATLDRIDHVVYAAGMGSGKFGFPFWNLEPDDWRAVVDVNLLGAVNVAHAFVPSLLEAPAGTLLFLSSIAGQTGSQTDPPYSAAKAGLINFAQCAAKDLAAHLVRVNTICPGMVKTELNRSVWQAWNERQPSGAHRDYEDWANDKVKQMVPLGRWQEPGDIAAMAVFLASPCAKNITGQTINVDGGFVMHS